MRHVEMVVWGIAITFVGAGCNSGHKEIYSSKYPRLKWGFTTQNFIRTSPVSVESIKGFIAYGKTEGFDWIELRDPDASLTVNECKELASFACENGIEIVYSIQRGLLDEDFWDVFRRGVVNASLFDGPRYFRALTTGREFSSNPTKLGWTRTELDRAVSIANEAAALAPQYGVCFAVENSDGDIDGRGKPYYGLEEFLSRTSPDLLFQFDTANFFWVPEVKISPQRAEALVRKFGPRMAYIHLKSANNGRALPMLDGNSIDFETVFNIMEENDVRYVAIELDAITDEQEIYENHAASIQYLLREGFIHLR